MKNIAQLTHDIDSLNKMYTTKVNQNYNEFSHTLLFTERNQNIPDHYLNKTDAKVVPVFDTENLYDSLSVIERKIALSRAIVNLKSASNYLSTQGESLHTDVKFIKRYEVNWNKKFTLSVACLVFFLIGAPLGAIIRKGGLGTPAVISILFFVIWYVISLSGEKLVEENLISTVAGMWASTYILLPVGIFLTYKASSDSVIMNIETYLGFFRMIKDYLYRLFIIGTRRRSSIEEKKI